MGCFFFFFQSGFSRNTFLTVRSSVRSFGSTFYGFSLYFTFYGFGLSFGSLVKNCNHKGLGIYYLLSAFIFGISGTLISVLIRIELYSTGNRIISPENQNFPM